MLDWQKLEALMDNDEDALKYIAQKYPAEIRRWLSLRARQGRFCPVARGVVKLLAWMAKDDATISRSVESGKLYKDG